MLIYQSSYVSSAVHLTMLLQGSAVHLTTLLQSSTVHPTMLLQSSDVHPTMLLQKNPLPCRKATTTGGLDGSHVGVGLGVDDALLLYNEDQAGQRDKFTGEFCKKNI